MFIFFNICYNDILLYLYSELFFVSISYVTLYYSNDFFLKQYYVINCISNLFSFKFLAKLCIVICYYSIL